MKDRLLKIIKGAFARFPVTSILIFLLFAFATWYIEINVNTSLYSRTFTERHYQNVYILEILIQLLVVFVFSSVTIQLLAERFSWSIKKNLLINLLVILSLSLVSVLLSIKDYQSAENLNYIFTGFEYRKAVLIPLSFVSIFAIPFIKDTDGKEWWNFAHTFVKSALVGLIFGVAVVIGLSLAFFAIESFWDFKVFDIQYEVISLFGFALVTPLVTLAGIYSLGSEKEYYQLNKFEGGFLKYVLTPLIIFYLVILYPYIIGMPFRDQWPANEVSIITGVLVAALFAGIIMSYGADKKLERLYTRYLSLLALIPIGFWLYSLYLRINAYYFSVNRIVVLFLILWVAGVALYYIFFKDKKPQYVVFSLIILVTLLYFAPFSAFYWGEKAQIRHLESIMERHLPKEGDKYTYAETLYTDDASELASQVQYINDMHTLKNATPLLSDNLINSIGIDENQYAKSYIYNDTFANEITYKNNEYNTLYYRVLFKEEITIPEGFSSLVLVKSYEAETDRNNITINNELFVFDLDTLSQFTNDGYQYFTENIDLVSITGSRGNLLVLYELDITIYDSEQVEPKVQYDANYDIEPLIIHNDSYTSFSGVLFLK